MVFPLFSGLSSIKPVKKFNFYNGNTTKLFNDPFSQNSKTEEIYLWKIKVIYGNSTEI